MAETSYSTKANPSFACLEAIISTHTHTLTKMMAASGDSNKEPSSPPPAKKKPQGWKAMPYILGNETFERLASYGLVANFMVYLVKVFHLDQVSAANIVNVWGGVTYFAPLLGGIISDAYTGRFKTIAFASFAGLLGMLAVTLTAWLPQLHPLKCDLASQNCRGPNKSQLGVLLTGLGLLAIATGGIRPCSIPFGIDQFDSTTERGVQGINSFFNWYYVSFTVVLILTQTALVYIQDSVSWVLGFGIPTFLMLSAIILFFTGTKIYVLVEPQGSIFSDIVQVFVAAFKKRRLKLPEGGDVGLFYDPPSNATTILKLPLTNQFRFLNKAALILDNELKPEGTPIDNRRLCSIQQVEDVKCLLKTMPIWASGIVTYIAMAQQSTFTVSQAMKMDRHLGPKFQIPPGSMAAISMITVAIWLPIYDRIVVPSLRKITEKEGGITVLQRMGIGIVFSFLSMIVAGLVEIKRRASANLHPQTLGIAPISVMWLAPVYILMGLNESFNVIGMIEFFNKEFPHHMKGVANSLTYISYAIANYLSSLMVNVIHETTGTRDRPDWMTNDINAGRLDLFYFIIAGIGVLNFMYFLYCAHRHRYKGSVRPEVKPYLDLELANSVSP